MFNITEDSSSNENVQSNSSEITPLENQEGSTDDKQGSGESFSVTEPSEVSEQFWADDEEDPDEAAPKASCGKDNQAKAEKESCLLCDQPLNDKPLICTRCSKRLREWMPGGVEELAVRGRWANPRVADKANDEVACEDSLYFCPVGAEHRLLFGRFSNLPRFAQCRPSSSSESDVDFETVRKRERSRRQKERRTKKKKKPMRSIHSMLSSYSCSKMLEGTCHLPTHSTTNSTRRFYHRCKKTSSHHLHSKK